MILQIIYRISNNSYSKNRIGSKKQCLENALKTFPPYNNIEWIILGDNLNNETYNEVQSLITPINSTYIQYIPINCGSGAASFNKALDIALNQPDNNIIYFLEDDYLHLPKSASTIIEGFGLGANYITLYNHPDKFIPPQNGGNPEVSDDGGYLTKLYKGETQFFYMVNSTTMTFASPVKTLKEDETILRHYTQGTYPEDYKMFLKLRNKGRSLLCPINIKSTHTEVNWLSPFID